MTGKTRKQWGKVFLGGFIGSLALGATAIDVYNNHDYGASIGPAMAAVMILAALGLTAVQGVAAIIGWSWLRGFAFLVCLVTTTYCAVNAYAARQSAHIMAMEAQSARYGDAREAVEIAKRDVRALRAEAADIAEALPSKELQSLHDAADKRAKDETTDPRKGATCGTLCRASESERDAYLPRIAKAKAKEAILARADEAEKRLVRAKDEASGGNAEANMVASQIAAAWGGDAASISRFIAIVMAGLGIAVTLAIASSMHDAVSLIVEGWRGEVVEEMQPEVAIQEQTPVEVVPLESPEPAPVEAVEEETPVAPQLDALDWIKPRIRYSAGSSVPFDEFFARYQREAAESGLTSVTKNAFGRALTALDFDNRGKSGKVLVIRNASLKPAKLEVVGG